jgi:hypothetical protein
LATGYTAASAALVGAGVIAKIMLAPPGALIEVTLTVRLAAIVCGCAALLLLRCSVLAGVVSGEAALIGGAWLTGGVSKQRDQTFVGGFCIQN